MTLDITRLSGPKNSKGQDFEELITQILLREHTDVHPVAGEGGDEGIDIFVGDGIDGNIDVYQCKYFPNRLGPPQRKQIIRSIESVLGKSRIKSYTLCLPKNLTPNEFRWIAQLEVTYRRKITIWDNSKITSLVLKHTDIQRMFFHETLGQLGKFFRSPREAAFALAHSAIVPQSFYPDAFQQLLTSQLVVISGPPHVGKTTLGRKMAVEVLSRHKGLQIVDVEQSGFQILDQTSAARNLVIVVHDPFSENEPPGAKWPLLRDLMQHNHLIITCRNNELISSNARHRLNESPFYQHVRIIPGDAYSSKEMTQIFDFHFDRTKARLSLEISTAIASDRFVEIAAKKLLSPHAIAYFFESILARETPTTFDGLKRIVENFNSIEEAVKSLYRTSSQSQRIFLLLIAVLNGQYEKSQANQIYDRGVQIAARTGGMAESSSFSECLNLFGDIVGSRMTRQYRYQGFEDEGLAFLHPTYREEIIRCGLASPLDRKWLYECARELVSKQKHYATSQDRYDLVCAGFEIIDEHWSELQQEIIPDVKEWIPYKGEFADHIQALYFYQLKQFSEKVPDEVLNECEILLKDGLVERSRGILVSAAFAAAAASPKRGLSILKASGDLKATHDGALGFARILSRQPKLARSRLEKELGRGSKKSKMLLISSLRFLDPDDFRELGLPFLEEFLDEPWKLKQRFMNLWIVPGQMEDRTRMPLHLETLLGAWGDSNDPRKYGFVITLWHHNMVFLNLPEDIWLPALKGFLSKKIDGDCEQSLISICENYIFELQNNFLKDEIISEVKTWLANFATRPEALRDWQERFGP
jgi:hypothetical protein